MDKKIRVGILFGGKSAEHEISLKSAKNVIEALDQDRYEPVLIKITKKGSWYVVPSNDKGLESISDDDFEAGLVLGHGEKQLIKVQGGSVLPGLDVVFPVLHGTFGEDGTVQGLLKLLDLPFVGSGVLGSAVCMDKDFTKRLLQQAGLPVSRWVLLTHHNKDVSFSQLKDELGLPLFVKPCNMGSSVGVSKVFSEFEFQKAVSDAFLYDQKVLVEEFIEGRELEVSVLGNQNPEASVVGEVLPQSDFYSYEAKYFETKGTPLEVPAVLNNDMSQKIKSFAIRSFKILGCSGFARCDFFLKKDGSLFINEVNSIPGFTQTSMYPKLWEACGVSYGELIHKLIQLAIEKHKEESLLKTTWD